VCYTYFWEAYKKVLPSKRHKAVGKESGLTNHIERFNNTLRQRVSRLVRKTFSKKLENHIGAIIYFINHYNKSLPLLHYLFVEYLKSPLGDLGASFAVNAYLMTDTKL
jgi:hypothetical protein